MEKSKEYIKLDDKIHEILRLLNRAIELKNVLAQNYLTDEEKKPLYNRTWWLINEINKTSEVEHLYFKKENESN